MKSATTGTPPKLLTIPEVAAVLRMTTNATYAAIERGQVPGVVGSVNESASSRMS